MSAKITPIMGFVVSKENDDPITHHIVGKPAGKPVDKPVDKPAGRIYYGNAEPQGPSIVVGGQEWSVGGWAGYKIDRRHARWKIGSDKKPSRYYAGRSHISSQDVLESIFVPSADSTDEIVGGMEDPFELATERFARALERLNSLLSRKGPGSVWERLSLPPDTPVLVPDMSPEDVRGTRPETDIASLHEIAENVSMLVASFDRANARLATPTPPESLPPAPLRVVVIRGGGCEDAICRLEKDTVGRANAIENYRAKIAAHFDEAAAALERLLAAAGKS